MTPTREEIEEWLEKPLELGFIDGFITLPSEKFKEARLCVRHLLTENDELRKQLSSMGIYQKCVESRGDELTRLRAVVGKCKELRAHQNSPCPQVSSEATAYSNKRFKLADELDELLKGAE